ncbi:MAG: lytic transglycosylase domain-containing protein [Nitrospirota bacterium]
MMWKNAALAALALALAGSAIVGETRISQGGPAVGTGPQVAEPVLPTLPPAIVVATRPTMSEILDIILHERPTAGELTGSTSGGKAFAAGSEEAHIAGILKRYTSDGQRADRIATALVREGRRRNVGSSLLLGVLLTENPLLDPRATSFVGARGLMQVMPFHAGKWGCSSPDLFDIEANICHGVAVLADNLSQSKTLPQALLSYNGCVRGTNTPGCRSYPRTVYGYARKGVDQANAGSRAFELPVRLLRKASRPAG